jgi:dTDP-glucose 4,6-dehydratase
MMRLLVTGGAGFIGSNLIRHVIDRPEIERLVNLDCLTYAGNLANLTGVDSHAKYVLAKVDLRDRAALRRTLQENVITHVIHMAAESHVDRSIAEPGAFIQTNAVGTYHLLEACRDLWEVKPGARTPDRRFHHVSTDEVFGSLGPTGKFCESTPYAPSSPYSASKAASDMLVRAWHRTYGLPVVISNCSNNYGPFQHPEKLIPVVIQRVLSSALIPMYGDGMHVRDWLHVSDHCEALWQVLTRGNDGETYCIGGDNERPNLGVVELICDTIDELWPATNGKSRRLIKYVADRAGHDRRYAIDTSKIRNELGWKPMRSFEEGIRETVRWYLDNQDWVANCANDY